MSGNMKAPYLSIVMSSRNDNYGGNMHKQMQTTLNSLITQLERYKVESEIIMVDYNPPPDRPLLKDTLELPNKTEYCTIRTVVVPYYIHKRYESSDKVPFNGAVAQNAGLRRARGRFVLLTNTDILFSNESIEYIGKQNLQEGKIYRTDRCEVPRNVIEISSLDERLSFCKENVSFIQTRYGTMPVLNGKKHLTTRELDRRVKSTKLKKLHVNAPDFLLMSKGSWHSLHGFLEADLLSFGCDTLLCHMAYFLSGLKEEVLSDKCCIYHIEHTRIVGRNTKFNPLNKILFHCLPTSFIINLKWCSKMMSNVFISKMLGGKSGWDVFGDVAPVGWSALLNMYISRVLCKKSAKNNIVANLINWARVLDIIYGMKRGKRQMVINDNAWGLGYEQLEDYTVVKAGWEM